VEGVRVNLMGKVSNIDNLVKGWNNELKGQMKTSVVRLEVLDV